MKQTQRTNLKIGAVLAATAGLSLACGLTSQMKTPTSARLPATSTPLVLQEQPTPLPPQGECTNRIGEIEDVNIPDDDSMSPGERFTKTWGLENAGTCTWTQDYLLAFVAEEELGGISPLPLGALVRPGEKAEVSMQFAAPPAPGRHRSLWMIRDGAGNVFGSGENGDQPFWVQIVTQATDTPADYAALTIDNAFYSGVCPLSLTLHATVLLNAPANAEMVVEMGSDDPNLQLTAPDKQVHTFAAGETYQTDYPILLTQSMQGWARFSVRGGAPLTSEKTAFYIRCK